MKTRIIKIMTAVLALVLGQSYVSAQTVVTGTVVDSNGVPVQGALVYADGVTTTTGFDGTFNIEAPASAKRLSVSYVGFTSETQSIKPEMYFRLGKESWWNEKPKAMWFVGPQALFTTRDIKDVTPGIMVGWVKKWGAYAKGFFWPEKSAHYTYPNYDVWYTGKVATSHYGGVIGVIYRLKCPVYLNAGVGIMNRNLYAQEYGGGWSEMDQYHMGNHYVIDAGVMIKIKKISINAGAMFNLCDDSDYDFSYPFNERFMVNVGINYCF